METQIHLEYCVQRNLWKTDSTEFLGEQVWVEFALKSSLKAKVYKSWRHFPEKIWRHHRNYRYLRIRFSLFWYYKRQINLDFFLTRCCARVYARARISIFVPTKSSSLRFGIEKQYSKSFENNAWVEKISASLYEAASRSLASRSSHMVSIAFKSK